MEKNSRKPGRNRHLRKIAAWLDELTFRRALLGVSERDVWKRIEELNAMYEAALEAERARYDALLEERIAQLRQEENGE